MRKFGILVISAALSVATVAAQPVISAGAAVHSASYAIDGLPNSGLPKGGIFTVFGAGLGPAQFVQATSLPLQTTLGGTQVRVTIGGTTVNCIMLFSSAGQVSAILPSNTPTGTGTLQVVYNGQASGSIQVRVLQNAFGIYTLNQAGSGPAVVQNFISVGNQPFNNYLTSASPGQVLTLWGTGLGPIAGDETALPVPSDMKGTVPVEVFVGGKAAQVQYAGRTSCCAGVDQINFVVPLGVEGCRVPVTVKIGNFVSNYATIAIGNGGPCNDPNGFTAAELLAAQQRGHMRIGSINLARANVKMDLGISLPGVPSNFDFTTEVGVGTFHNYNFDLLMRTQGDVTEITVGSCTTYGFRGEDPVATDPVVGQGLNAGNLSVQGPGGTRQIKQEEPGVYSEVFYTSGFGGMGGTGSPFLSPGSYTVSATGAAVGAFSKQFNISPALNWTNENSITAINRAQGQLFTWSGGDPNGTVMIVGSAFAGTENNQYGASFVCLEKVSAGQFMVPAHVLLTLPASRSSTGGFDIVTDMLLLGTTSDPVRFNANNLDLGFVSFSSVSGKTVKYQ